MALSATLVWEVQSSAFGLDTNGGGFDKTVPNAGIDYSQGSVQTLGNITIGTNSSTLTNVGGSAGAFNTTHIGNVVSITSGSGFTTGWYFIIGVSGGVATVDRSVGTPGSTGGVGGIGGPFASPGAAAAVMVSGNVCYVKNTGVSYSISSTSNNVSNGQVNPPAGVSLTQPTAFIGYQNNRTFLNTDSPPTLNVSVALGMIFNVTNSTFIIRNLKFTASGAALGTQTFGVEVTGSGVGYVLIERCIFTSLGTAVFLGGGVGFQYGIDCYATGCTTVAFQTGNTLPTNSSAFIGCVSDTNGTAGTIYSDFLPESGMLIAYCIGFNGNGAMVDDQTVAPANVTIFQCSSYGHTNATHGYAVTHGTNTVTIINTVSFNEFGFRDNNDLTPNYLNRYLAIAGTINTPVTIVNTANLFSAVTVSVNPYNNAVGKDFSLNNTATGGAACRSAGYPTSYVGLNTNNFPDIGAAEHTQVLPGYCVMAVQDASYQNPVFAEPGRVVITGRGGVFGATPRRTITQIGGTTGASSTTATIVLPGIGGAQGGDLLLVILASRTTDHTPVTVSSNNPDGGWVKFFEFSTLAGGPNSLTLTGFYAFNTLQTTPIFMSSPVTGINGFKQAAAMSAWRNVDHSQPIDVISSGVSSIGASANTVMAPSIITITDQDQLLIPVGDWDGGNLSATFPYLTTITNPSGGPTVGFGKNPTLFTPPGATGTNTVTDSFGTGDPDQILSAINFALRPAPFIATPVAQFTIQKPETLPAQEPEPGLAFITSGNPPVVNTPYTVPVVAAQVSPPSMPEPGITRSILGMTPPGNVVPRVLVAGFVDLSHDLAASLSQGSAVSRSAVTVPIVAYRAVVAPLAQSQPPMEPESGSANIGLVFPPVPIVPTTPLVSAIQSAPPFIAETRAAIVFPISFNLVPPYQSVYAARMVQIPIIENEEGRSFIGKVFSPVPIVKTPPPVVANQVVPPQEPEPGGSWVYPLSTELPPVPVQTPICAIVAAQEYPHNQVEPGRAIFRGVGVIPVPLQTYILVIVPYQTTPPQYDQGSAFSAPNPDVVPSVSTGVPNPPGVMAIQVAPPFVPEDKKPQSILGVVKAFYMPTLPVTASQSDRDLQELLDQGRSLYMPRGIVGVPSQMYSVEITGIQIIPPFEPEAGSAFTGGTSLIPQPPAAPPPRSVVASQNTPPPDTFPEAGRVFMSYIFPPRPFVSPFSTTAVQRVEPPFSPERGSVFIFSQVYRYYPFQFITQGAETVPQPFPESGRAYIGAVVPPVPKVSAISILAVQVLPIPAALPEPGQAIYLGVGQNPPLHPMWRPAQIVTQQTPAQPTFPEDGRMYIGNVFPPSPQVKTPLPVYPAVQVSPPLFPEEGKVVAWKVPPQPNPSPPPYPAYGFIVQPPVVPELGSATSTHAYAPTPIVSPGFVTYPITRVDPPFEPEVGSAFCASAGPFVPPPFVPPPLPVTAVEVTPWPAPPPGSSLSLTQYISVQILTPGRVISLTDIYAPKTRIVGVVGG